MLFYCVLVVILQYSCAISFGNVEHRRFVRQDDLETDSRGADACITPDYQPGNCIAIRNCKSLFTLVNRAEEPVRLYLRRSLCGRDLKTGIPKVCCAKISNGNVPTPRIPNLEVTDTSENPPLRPTSIKKVNDVSKCGKSNRTALKISAGRDAELGAWPWMAALYYRTNSDSTPTYRCGGTLISKDFVITAAHCFDDQAATLTVVRLGDLNLEDDVNEGATPIDVPVGEVILHPNYTSRPAINDVALIRLRTPVTFTDLISPICILSGTARFKSNGFYENKRPFITGWGRLHYGGPLSSVLQEAQVDIVDNEKCAENYANYRAVIDHRVLCAGGGGKDSCKGDSGGPMIIPIGRSYYLAGIVSYGVGCADPDFPGVYTRIAEFTEWIARVTKLPL